MAVGQAEERKVVRELGRRIQAARLAADLSQEDAASAAGIDYKRFQRLEQGAVNPTVRTLVRVARALGTTFWALMITEPVASSTRSRKRSPSAL